MPRIIDFHTHVFPEAIAEKAVAQIGNHYSLKMHGKGILSDLSESADKHNIDYVVFHATATKPAQVQSINSWIAENQGGKFLGFGTLHPDMEGAEQEFKRIQLMGLHGIKLHPDFQGFNVDSPKMDPIYEIIGDKLPVLFHVGDEKLDHSSPVRLARVIERFPRLRAIAAHLGGHKQWETAMNCLIGKNIYLDTSSALHYMDTAFANRIIREHGSDKVLFGTDYPIMYHDMELEAFYKLDLTQKEREDILYNNAAKLLRIKP